MSDTSVYKSLSEFGLSDLESRIYVYLLNKQPQTIVEISRELHIPRTSLYDNVLKLVERGLVQKHVLYRSQKFEAFPITILQTLLEREQAKLEKLKEGYIFLEKNLSRAIFPSTNTQVRYYHGVQGFMQMMWNALSAQKEIIGYSEFGRAEIVGQKFLDKWMQEMIDKRIMDRVIANPTETVKNYLSLSNQKQRSLFQNTRYLPKDSLYISGDTTIYNNVFAVAYWKQGEVVGVEIENPELVKTQKSLFEQMWGIAK